MFIKFEKIIFRNFLSYGNKSTTIEFLNGMNYYSGSNGTGKSVLLDVLSFSLFGQPYRKIKIAELINRKNKKNLYTEIHFKIDNSEYKIIRTLSPTSLEVMQNGNKLQLLSSKKLTQTEIDRMLGINHELFRQIISLAISYNRPFLSLPLGEKRDIIENIFGVKIFGEMHKVVKKRIVNIKGVVSVGERTIGLLEASVCALKRQINDTQRAIKNYEENKANDKNKIFVKIEKYKKEIECFTGNIEKNKNNIKNINFEKLKTNKEYLEKIEKELNSLNILKLNVEKEKSVLNNSICFSCKQEIKEEHKKKEIEKLEIIQNDTISKINNKTIEIEKIKKDIKNDTDQKQSNNELQKEIENFQEKINFYSSEMNSLELDIKTIDERKINLNIEQLNKKLETDSEEYIKSYKELTESMRKIKIYDTISDILSEEGIKSYFFKKLIPLLNFKINEVLNKFDLPLQIKFNNSMEEEIFNYSNGNDTVNYFSLSEGEKKRIDIAMMIAFINVTKIINNWQCNLLVMDELLDSSVDGDGLDKMIECLRSYINSSKKNIGIYLISHREIESELFDNIYIIRKKQGFSEIEIKTVDFDQKTDIL